MTTMTADQLDTNELIDEPTVVIPLPTGTRLTAEQMAEKSPEYPYGRRADGTPRQKPGAKATGSTPPRMAPAPKPRKPGPKATTSKAVPDYRPGIIGLLQVPIMGLTFFGKQAKNPALAADGMALAMHAPVLAEALNDTARSQPQVARALDSILKAGPYGAIIAAVVPLALQIAANHKVIPSNPAMGIQDPEHLAAAAEQQLSAMAGGPQ